MQESSRPHAPRSGDDGIVLRSLDSVDDFNEAVVLQDEIWGAGFSDRVPAAILRVGQKVGGVSAGAFGPSGRMLGFVFGLTGIRDGRLVHWSDMLAVRQEARGQHLGERLKEYQRDVVRALGVTSMLWTFDPLVARNAHFNINKLGARIAEYAPNFYGSNTGSVLHGDLPTDRLVAEWILNDSGKPRTAGGHTAMAAATDIAVATVVERGHPRTVEPLPSAARVRIPIPTDIEPVISASREEALAWRLATRSAMMHYLARGYRVSAFHRGSDHELACYELSTSSTGHA